MKFLLLYVSLTVVVVSVRSATWADEDTVVIDLPTEEEIISARGRRQLGGQLQYPGFPSGFPGFCYTANGREGQCATMRQCYPILYSFDDGKEDVIVNTGLAEFLQESAGHCETAPVMANYFYFKADAELRQQLICCSNKQRPTYPGSRPKPPGRPTQRTTPSPPRPPSIPFPKPPNVTEGSKMDIASNCGKPWVVGGGHSSPGKHPWIVALTNNGRQFCAGSLISSYFVLTAAHCVAHMTGADIARLRVHLGEHRIGVAENTEQFAKVARVFYHRHFSMRTLHNDVAVLKLQSPARETPYIRTICLSQNKRQTTSKAVLAGWGQVADGGSQSSILREVTLDLWTNDKCKSTYGIKAPGGIIDSMICAGSHGSDACRGDSGGPLVVNNSANIPEQIGIVSWGIGCGSFPGVYSRVSSFIPWIEKNRKM